MSTHWIAAGRYKLGPESRIACANLLLVVLLACATLFVGPFGGRSILKLLAWGFLHAKLVVGSNPLQRLQHVRARHAKTDFTQPPAGTSGDPRSRPILVLDRVALALLST
jgi:hypothetical protein